MFKIIDRRYWWFLISALAIVPGLISIVLFGIPRSIDFIGGSFFELAFAPEAEVSEADLIQAFEGYGFDAPPQVVTATDPETGTTRYQIRARAISSMAETQGVEQTDYKAGLYSALEERFGAFEELQFADVGPSVGRQVTQNAAIAVALASLGILLYLTLMFRNVTHSFRFGVIAITAMLHDVVLVLGVASIMGHFFKWEIDALFLTALLTVIGFSVHDSIVVFDRIRENSGRMRGLPFERVVNHSVVQTLDRSINTQLTAVFTLMAIYIYSQGQLKTFLFWLIIGIISGTYSSIFNAAPLLVVWNNREWNTWFGRGKDAEAAIGA